MAKRVKDKWLRARVDGDMDTTVTNYTIVAEMSVGDLVREAVKEYMINHPVKNPKVETEKLDPSVKKLAGKE